MQTVLDGKYQAQSSVVALGMFDGVHIGHQVLLQKAKALAAQHGVPLVVCTFVQHPLTLIAPEKAPAMLTTLDERAAQMEALGVDVLYAQPFTKRIMTMPPEDYVGQLVRHFHPVAVVCGYNHTFGQGGKGTPALLSALGAALGFETVAVPQITLKGQEVSSTAIRAALEEGDVDKARQLLGRPYAQRASLAGSAGGRYDLMMEPDGKQELPAGKYRALCDDGAHRYPVLLHIRRAGRAQCYLHQAAHLGETLQLQYLTQMELDF